MELPKKYLDNLANRVFMVDFDTADIAEKWAKAIGDSLELLDKDESRFVIEHSYEALFRNFQRNIGAGESLWKEWVISGMGEHHKDLQVELSNKKNDRMVKKGSPIRI